MIEFLHRLFNTDFPLHAVNLRSSGLIWLNAFSDGLTAVAYLLIPIALIQLIRRRRDLAFHWLFGLFALFIACCGGTHVLSLVTLWIPVYRLEGLFKAVTAIISFVTAVVFLRSMPFIANQPGRKQFQVANEAFRVANEALKREIKQRETAEGALREIHSDLEDRFHQRSRELEEKNDRLRDLTAAWDLSHGLIRDQRGLISFWCEGNEQLYGWKKEEAIGMSSHQLLKTEFLRPLNEIEKELAAKGTWCGELVHTTKHGSKLHVATHWVLQNQTANDAVSVIEVNNDITDRLRAEEATRRLADLVESSIDAIVASDRNGIVTNWNSSADALFGYTASEMIGRSIHALAPLDRQEEEANLFRDVIHGQGAMRFESVRVRRTGERIDVAVTISPIRNSVNAVMGTSMIFRDITEVKAQEEAIRVSEERQRLAMEAGQVGLWYVDLPSGRSIWSQRCKELHGIRSETEIEVYPFALRLIHPEDRDRVEADFREIVEGASNVATEYRTRGLDQKTRWVQSRGNAHRNAGGEVVAVHGTVIDLTARREMEDQLRRVNTELEQFAYAAAHDLQEPLRNVALAAEILKTNPEELAGGRNPELLNMLIDNSRRMEAMVKDLLTYSHSLDEGENQVSQVKGDIVLAKVLQNLATAIAEKQAQVTWDVLPDVPMRETHLLQVLQNLVSNSLKYAGDHAPVIHIGGRSSADNVLLYVKDHGMGISPQFHQRAFGMFKRLHNGSSAKGTGIGLAVCKRIVEHYGGRIWIESQLGDGATFLFSIPCISHQIN